MEDAKEMRSRTEKTIASNVQEKHADFLRGIFEAANKGSYEYRETRNMDLEDAKLLTSFLRTRGYEVQVVGPQLTGYQASFTFVVSWYGG